MHTSKPPLMAPPQLWIHWSVGELPAHAWMGSELLSMCQWSSQSPLPWAGSTDPAATVPSATRGTHCLRKTAGGIWDQLVTLACPLHHTRGHFQTSSEQLSAACRKPQEQSTAGGSACTSPFPSLQPPPSRSSGEVTHCVNTQAPCKQSNTLPLCPGAAASTPRGSPEPQVCCSISHPRQILHHTTLLGVVWRKKFCFLDNFDVPFLGFVQIQGKMKSV